MGPITFDKLYINALFDVISVREFSFSQNPGKHAEALLTCLASRKSLEDHLKKEKFQEIQVCAADIDFPIFAGIVKDSDIYYDGPYGIVKIKAVSGSYLLDQDKKIRSFQKEQGYKELMNSVLDNMGKAIYIINDQKIQEPPIQYGETDWQFLKRMAGRFYTLITPDITSSPQPRLFIGLRNGKLQGTITTDTYVVKQKKFVKWGEGVRNYEFESYDHYKIGDQINFNGQVMHICEKYGELKNGILRFRYTVSSPDYYKITPYHNHKLHGKEIRGRVVEVMGERIKISLETDFYSESDIHYYYRWMPESGNLLYCMPELGAFVTLYFCTDNENSGICINCIQNATEKMKKNWKPENKYFITPQQKMLYLKKDKMKIGFDNADIRIFQDHGVEFNSNEKITLRAKGNIELHAVQILATAPKEINIIRKNILHPSMINMHNDFDSKGKIGGLKEKLHHDDKAIPDKVLGRDGV